MAKKISALSQKGGVGKSTTIRLIAREFAFAGWSVKIGDFDINQGTCVNWKRRREQHAILPEVAVETFRTVSQALKVEKLYDLFLFDGQPHSSSLTLEIARVSDVILLPTGLSRDDLEPSILLAHELINNKIKHNKIAFVLCRVGESEIEIAEARNYINKAGYKILDGELPEKVGYRRASDDGRAVTEANHPSLKTKAEKFAQKIVDFINTN
jgi:chromosome partitioning protein